MRGFILIAALSGAFAASAGANAKIDLGPDGSYVMGVATFDTFRRTPGADQLGDIVKLGARAIEWGEVLQKDVLPENREQLWRRVDRIGHEPSPEKPLIYNPDIIVDAYEKALAATPKSIVDVLQSSGALPTLPPDGLTIKDVIVPIRAIYTIYSRASRWLALYQYHEEMRPVGMDMRGWLKLRQNAEALRALTTRWDSLEAAERARFVAEVSAACTSTFNEEPSDCVSEHAWLEKNGAGSDAAKWLDESLAAGQVPYDARFTVRSTHPNARTSKVREFGRIEIPATGIDEATFTWIQDRVNEAWAFNAPSGQPALDVKLFTAEASLDGALKVVWENGALPHVNGIAGDTITMDANEPRWLEQVQITMRHEFGHVLGFPDCYVEFWDESQKAFVDYALDPDNAMCALSGRYLDVHRDALLKGYFPSAATRL